MAPSLPPVQPSPPPPCHKDVDLAPPACAFPPPGATGVSPWPPLGRTKAAWRQACWRPSADNTPNEPIYPHPAWILDPGIGGHKPTTRQMSRAGASQGGGRVGPSISIWILFGSWVLQISGSCLDPGSSRYLDPIRILGPAHIWILFGYWVLHIYG